MATTGYPKQYYGLSFKKKPNVQVTPNWDQMQELSTAFKRTPAKDYNFEAPINNPSLEAAVEANTPEATLEDGTDYTALFNSLMKGGNTKQVRPEEALVGSLGQPGKDYSALPSAREAEGSGPANFMEAAGTQQTIQKNARDSLFSMGSLLPSAASGNLPGAIRSGSSLSISNRNRVNALDLMEKPAFGSEFEMSPAEAATVTQAMETGAGGTGEGGCCFIFIASHGFLHPIVREYRDKHMNTRNRRGYYWLADRLIPWMKKSKTASWLVEWFMVRPMTCYGKYYFNLDKIGSAFAPVTKFWLMVFTILGMRPPYTRKGTQEVV